MSCSTSAHARTDQAFPTDFSMKVTVRLFAVGFPTSETCCADVVTEEHLRKIDGVVCAGAKRHFSPITPRDRG